MSTARRRAAPRGGTFPRSASSAREDERGMPLALFAPTATAVSVALGVCGHALAHQSAPPVVGVLLAVLICGLLWTSGQRREFGGRALLLRVWLCQALVHISLMVAATTDTPHGAHHHGVAADVATTGSGTMASLDARMLAAHLVAGAGVAWWLRRGERIAWRAARRIVGRLRPPVAPSGLVPALTCRSAVAPFFDTFVPAVVVAPVGRRGPPVVAV